MMYRKQKDTFSCAPVAILNALRWAGKTADSDEIDVLCRLNPTTGTIIPYFEQALYHYSKDIFKISKRIQPSINVIEKELSAGKSAIVNFKYKNSFGLICGHYTFIDYVSKSGKTFGVVNMYSNGSTRRLIRRKTLIRQLSFGIKDKNWPTRLWFLRKINDQ